MFTNSPLAALPGDPHPAKVGRASPGGSQGEIRLYGKNLRHPAKGTICYWTDIQAWRKRRKRVTRREPFYANVTTKSKEAEFRNLSPMRLPNVECYRENGRMITAANVEVAWQYSKVYSHISENGRLVDVSARFITRDASGRQRPSRQWFRWRDAAFTNPRFVHTHPEFGANKKFVRRAFPKGPANARSRVAFWYWQGEVLDAVQARQRIYATLYRKAVLDMPGFRWLRQIVQGGEDVWIYDFDGYDWIELGRSPADCLHDLGHSFGHGLVIQLLLMGMDPCRLAPRSKGRPRRNSATKPDPQSSIIRRRQTGKGRPKSQNTAPEVAPGKSPAIRNQKTK